VAQVSLLRPGDEESVVKDLRCQYAQRLASISAMRLLSFHQLYLLSQVSASRHSGYVVMPEHVHLLVSEPKKTILSKAVQALKLSVSVQSKKRPFWQVRYYDFNVYNEEKRVEKLRYMHRNPVKRGLVEKPEDWPWSSFRHYATGIEGTVEIESFWTGARKEGYSIPGLKCETWATQSCEG
jgi:putative transposase